MYLTHEEVNRRGLGKVILEGVVGSKREKMSRVLNIFAQFKYEILKRKYINIKIKSILVNPITRVMFSFLSNTLLKTFH